MFYPVSKILTSLLLPSSLSVMLVAAGVALLFSYRHKVAGRRLVFGGLALQLGLGIVPVGNVLLHPLEQRAASFPLPVASDRIDGILILGGFEDGWVSTARPGLSVNESAERLTEGLRLARRYPEAKVVFTGGSGAFLRAGSDAAGPVARWLADAGVPTERIVLEDKSRNTHENAVYTREMIRPQPDQRWLLVTSAFHMPRSVGIFRKAGFDVVPYPVDYRTRDAGDMLRLFACRMGLSASTWRRESGSGCSSTG